MGDHDQLTFYRQGKLQEYIAASERAEKDIATWPKWMQRNLTPPREEIFNRRDMDIAWAAGFFDGEGTIDIAAKSTTSKYGVKYTYHSLALYLGNNDKRAILKMQEIFGGSVTGPRKQEGKKDIYVWRAAASRAGKSIKEMYPYFQVKKEQAEVALEFAETINPHFGRSRVPDEINNRRRELREKVMSMRGDNHG